MDEAEHNHPKVTKTRNTNAICSLLCVDTSFEFLDIFFGMLIEFRKQSNVG